MQSPKPTKSDHANLYGLERLLVSCHVNIPGVIMLTRAR
jgi:hypothetical protein